MKTMEHINKMGIELEGAWNGTRGKRPFQDVQIKYDGSVHFSNTYESEFVHFGEIVSDPLSPDDLAVWAQEHCPDQVNSTCGTHIHVSVKGKTLYGSLLNASFANKLLSVYREYNENVIKGLDSDTYHAFHSRLAGFNRYCQKGFKGLDQVDKTSKEGVRYRQLNYCYALKGTLEIRVLPATTNRTILGDLVRITAATIEEWCNREYRPDKVRFRRT